MAVFAYRASDSHSSAQAGTVVADTARQARDLLRGRGLTVTRIDPVPERPPAGWLERRRGRLAQGEVVELVRELATLLKAGIPLLAGMDTCIEQHRGRFRTVLQQLRDQIAAGKGLAEAMESRPAYFDQFAVSIVHVGENTGTLESALAKLAEFKEKAHRLRSRVLTALVYPSVVLVVGLAVSVFLMSFVVPNLLDTLRESGRPLPWATRVVSTASAILLDWWWAVGGGLVAIAVLVKVALRTGPGQLAGHRLILRVPVIGDLVRKENTARLAVVMAALLRSGLQFVNAIEITQRTIRNRVFRRALDNYRDAVSAGRDIAAPLRAAGVFSPMVVQILAVGQQAGELEEMLEQLAEAYEQQVATAATRLTALLEPALIVLLAVIVGFIAFATVLPILEASNVM